MVEREMKIARVVIISLITASLFVPLPGYAEETGGGCPKMQFVVVHDSQDAKAQSSEDTGFLGDVVSPVVTAANDKNVDKSAGFSEAPNPSSSASASAAVPSTSSMTATTTQQGSEWKKQDYWGSTSTKPQEPTATSSPTVTSSAVTTTSTSTNEPQSSAKIGRTYVNITGIRTGAFIPGVHAETDDDWRSTTAAGKEKTNQTIADIHKKCPTTKVALVGDNQGAAIVSEISRDIGAGKGVIEPNLVAGVATFADPTRGKDQPTVASGADAPAAAPGTSGRNVSAATEGFASETTEGTGLATVAEKESPRGYGELSDRTVSWCAEGDTRCGVKKPAPLTRLAEVTNKDVDFAKNPEGSVRHIADVLGPAVALAGAETLAEDVNFGSNGFTFNRAESAEKTLIGRIADNSESHVEQSEFDQRLVAAGQQLGGMALAAGVTLAKKVVTPSNIAQIAAAATLDPMAGVALAGVKVIEASVDLFTPETATTGALRVMDEAKAGGVEVPEIAETTVATVVSQTVEDSAYRKQPMTESGDSAQSATTSWLSGVAADELGDEAPEALVAQSKKKSTVKGTDYDQKAVTDATASMKKVGSTDSPSTAKVRKMTMPKVTSSAVEQESEEPTDSEQAE